MFWWIVAAVFALANGLVIACAGRRYHNRSARNEPRV